MIMHPTVVSDAAAPLLRLLLAYPLLALGLAFGASLGVMLLPALLQLRRD